MMIVKASTALEFQICADIWLEASLAAHTFVAPEFWQGNHSAMRERYLPASEVYLAQERTVSTGLRRHCGFAAVHQDELAALFVLPAWWGKGVGSLLLRHVQERYDQLSLAVYAENVRAVRFYQKHGFILLREQTCPSTGAPELAMTWRKEHEASQSQCFPSSQP